MKKVFNPKSKTHNLGGLLVILGGVQTFLPDILPYFEEQQRGIITAIIGITVIYLRSVTTQPVDQK